VSVRLRFVAISNVKAEKRITHHSAKTDDDKKTGSCSLLILNWIR